jgi:hypothetical protein
MNILWIVLIVALLLSIGGAPLWPHQGFGYGWGPSGLGLVAVVVLLFLLLR